MRRAAMANIRPSCPLPSTPMAQPGRMGRFGAGGYSCREADRRERTRVCFGGSYSSRQAEVGVLVRQDADRQQGGILRARIADRERADGMPAGICTMDSSESTPFRMLLLDGTPSTGRMVWAATMPGRWAAPPAAAMMTSIPRRCAPLRIPPSNPVSDGPRRCGARRKLRATGQHLAGMLHGFPIGLAAHDDADQRSARELGDVQTRAAVAETCSPSET